MQGAPFFKTVYGLIPIQGGYSPALPQLTPVRETPPRMRGTLTEECLARCLDKKHPHLCREYRVHLTPRTAATNHPRVCEEHHPSSPAIAVTGSSPRMRGARSVFRLQFSPRGHPRVCGEHLFPLIVPRSGDGSSPHMRGARRWMLAA